MSQSYPSLRHRRRLARRKAASAVADGKPRLAARHLREAAAWRELARLAAMGAELDRGLSKAKREAAERN